MVTWTGYVIDKVVTQITAPDGGNCLSSSGRLGTITATRGLENNKYYGI
jgi:hypothetical protein